MGDVPNTGSPVAANASIFYQYPFLSRLMHCMHGVDELAGEPFEIVSHILAVMANILTQIFALDEFGHQECQRIVYLHVDNLADSRIADLAHSHGLTAQALTGDHLRAVFGRIRIAVVGIGERRPKDLHRIRIASAVNGAPYGTHGTGTKA